MRHLINFLKGYCMGAADIVPGVSGGTMALILDIHTPLVTAIRNATTPRCLKALKRFDVKTVAQLINLPLISMVGIGILAAIISLSHSLEYMLTEHPLIIWSIFFGLVAASVWVVQKRIKRWSPTLVITALIGTVLAYLVTGLVPTQTAATPLYFFGAGVIAICAMILPGISGSFLLVVMGKYEQIISAVNDRDLPIIVYVGAGAVVGILAFSHVLHWLLSKYHDLTVAFLTGLMLGSLRVLWPWKFHAVNTIPDVGGELWTGVACMLVGCIVVLALDRLASKNG